MSDADGADRPFGPDGGCVPVPVCWRALRGEDLATGDDGGLYAVQGSAPLIADGPRGPWELTLRRGDWCAPIEGRADDAVDVLLPAQTAAAVALVRDVLGASLIATRLTEAEHSDGGDAPDPAGGA